jgi:hypothetical protein
MGSGEHGVSTFPIVGLIFVGLGTLIIYNLLIGLLNTTTLQITRTSITVHQSPVPTFNNRELPVADLTQLYCIEHHHLRSLPTYHLYLLLRNGRKQLLLPNIDQRQALFIEQEIEAFLGIPDQHVPGAVE